MKTQTCDHCARTDQFLTQIGDDRYCTHCANALNQDPEPDANAQSQDERDEETFRIYTELK
jgi:glutaredoxin